MRPRSRRQNQGCCHFLVVASEWREIFVQIKPRNALFCARLGASIWAPWRLMGSRRSFAWRWNRVRAFQRRGMAARWGYQRVSLLLQPLGLSSMAHASADISLSGEDVRAGAQRAQYELGISCAKLSEVASSAMPLMGTPTLPCPASRSTSSAEGGCIEFRILLRCLRNLS